MSIKILSYFEVNVECSIIEKYSNTLVVILPGIGYTCDKALLDYSKKLACELGYDVLPIEYGFQVARKQMVHLDEFNIVIKETKEILLKALDEKYKNIIFIGKSIGTLIQASIQSGLTNYEIKNVYLTPISETVKVGIKDNSLVISGNADPMINSQSLEALRNNKNIKYIEIDGADHSLNIRNDILKSIEILGTIIKIEKEYLSD